MTKKQVFLIGLALALVPTLRAQETPLLQSLKTAFQSDVFTLSGYGHFGYSVTQHPSGTVSNSSFEVARIILLASGKLGSKQQFNYGLMYDAGPSAMFHELYGEWTPFEGLHLRAGQYKVPFTLENPMSPSRLETIRLTRAVTAMSGSTGDVNQFNANGSSIGAKSGRDAGVQLSGRLFPQSGFYRMEYYTGIFNGTGLNTRDNDNSKDWIAAAYWQPVQGLRLGGSLYAGQLYGLTRNRWATSAEYTSRHFYGRSEYIAATDGSKNRYGYYSAFVYKPLPDRWEFAAKYEFYNDNTSLSNNGVSDLTFAANYYFAPLSRIQLNYVFSDDARTGANSTLLAQLQVFF
jgi:hypothetical protein